MDTATVIDSVTAEVYRFPTPQPEADGTLEWDATVAVTAEVRAGDVTGLGWTYSAAAAGTLIEEKLASTVTGRSADDVAALNEAMRRAVRNLGGKGLAMQAISAVDMALWDLKARLHGLPLRTLLGSVRERVAVYGSGGFTTMSDTQLHEQVDEWRALGCRAMKIKIGESWGQRVDRDLARVRGLREWAGDGVALMVDANGAYPRGKALRVGAELDELGVVWFEEPVSSDDVAGLRAVRAATRCDIAAGEYAADSYDARALCAAVDCLQLDATRCGGYTGFLRCAAVAAAHNLEVSAHCGPALHAPVAAATVNFRHLEYFADHARLEPLLVTGVPSVHDGALVPNDSPGHGMRMHPEAARFRRR